MDDHVSLTPSRKRASRSAAEVLRTLKFDPLENLVDTYTELELELARHKGVREGTHIEKKLDGNPRAYHSDAHIKTLEQMASLNDKLMKYVYAPAKEAEDEKPPVTFIVQLADGTEVKT